MKQDQGEHSSFTVTLYFVIFSLIYSFIETLHLSPMHWVVPFPLIHLAQPPPPPHPVPTCPPSSSRPRRQSPSYLTREFRMSSHYKHLFLVKQFMIQARRCSPRKNSHHLSPLYLCPPSTPHPHPFPQGAPQPTSKPVKEGSHLVFWTESLVAFRRRYFYWYEWQLRILAFAQTKCVVSTCCRFQTGGLWSFFYRRPQEMKLGSQDPDCAIY